MIENLVITNKVNDLSVEVTMSSEAYVLESVDFGTISGSHQTYHYPTQKGLTKYSSTLGTREPNIVGWIIGENENEIKQRKKRLNSLVNPLEDLEIIVEGEYFITLTPDSTIKYGKSYQENNDVMCKFEISGTCYDPLFSSSEKKETASGQEGCFMFPLIIPEEGYIFSKKLSSLICQIENDGTMESGIEITLLAKGTVKNPSLISVNTQECMKLLKTLTSGEKVIINTNIGKRAIDGYVNGEKKNYFKYRDIENGDWISLLKGINLYRYDADDGLDNLEVYISYKKSWLEVDE